MPLPNVPAETNTRLTERNTMSVPSAGLPARPGSEFKEPDSGLPLKCDMCEGEDEPLCVKWCLVDALTYEEREEEVEEEVEQEELEIGLESLANKYRIAEDNGYRCPNVKEGLKSLRPKEED